MSNEYDALPETAKVHYEKWAAGLSTDDYPMSPVEIFSASVMLPSRGLELPAPVRKEPDGVSQNESEL